MITVEFSIKGKKFDPDDIGEGVSQTILKSTRALLQEGLGEIRCPEHGIEPKIQLTGEDLNHLSIVDCGCCNLLDGICMTELSRFEEDSFDEPCVSEILGETAHRIKQRFLCLKCKRERSHILQYAQTSTLYTQINLRNREPYWFILQAWLIWKCKVCQELSFEIATRSPGWFEGDWDDNDYDRIGEDLLFSQWGDYKHPDNTSKIEPECVNRLILLAKS